MHRKWLALAFLSCALLVVCSWAQIPTTYAPISGIYLQPSLTTTVAGEDIEFKLGIVHTNDTHGHLQAFRSEGKDGWGGVARRRVEIQRSRADTSYYWLTLDAGDVFQGTPISNLLTGFLDIECMNQMGYDAMCLGNHEFDFGYELLRGRISDANFDILCSNVIDKERGVQVAKPYTVLKRGDYRIGIIGVTSETLLGETHPRIKDYAIVQPPIPIVSSLAKYLRSIGCDVVIALTHQGYNRDIEMAKAIPELDVIVGGHSHTQLDEPTRVGNVIVTQNYQWGKNLGVLKLTFIKPTGDQSVRFELKSVDNAYVPLASDKSEDDGLKAFIADYQRRFDAEMGRIVCRAAHDFPVDDIRLAENPLANLIADSMRKVTESDVVMFNGGNFRSPIAEGEVTFGDLYAVLPYDNFLMKVKVSGAKLKEIMEFAGQQYGDGGFPQVSGMSVVYVDMKLAGLFIGDTPPKDFDISISDNGLPVATPKNPPSVGWEEVVLGKEYSILVTDFLAIGGDNFPLSEDPYGPGYTGLEQRATFAQWASQQGVISGKIDGRVQFTWDKLANPGLRD